ncbi:hypothetical protein ELQ94_07375 [Labedella endophytica]|uniref:Uncharacterized protein n=1 Tax=Labedella endophytica TaxID=1523160 RepID=A0A433JT06_9MICO|nr:hypothetical protein ELQ94_07375 [Labedella endophytica]
MLTAEPGDAGSTLAGAQTQRVDLERLSGFTASSCDEPAAESWLVGGSTDVGQTTVLTLANPSTVEAVVSLEVSGEAGLVDAPGASGIVVAAGSQRILSLAGIAPNLLTPVVHVMSVGAPVVAALQQSAVRSITAEGVEAVVASSGPAVEQVIPGFAVPSSRPVERSDGYDYRVPGVRVLVPGSLDGEVTIVARAADGSLSEPRVVRAAAGSVVDVPLDDLGPGTYDLSISSDEPVVAAGHSASRGAGGDDFAWFASTDPLDDAVSVAIADGPGATINLVNTTDEDRSVTLASGGSSDVVELAAGTSVVRPVSGGRVYGLTGAGGLHAAVTLIGGIGIASYPVTPPSAASDPVVVRTR